MVARGNLMLKIVKRCLFAFGLVLFAAGSAHAAKVECSFLSETIISTSGEWMATEMDFIKLMELFGDGLTLPLESSLLGNLDTGEVFLAGEVDRGKVFLRGGDMGVEGKLIGVDGNIITIYDGMCNIGFGQ